MGFGISNPDAKLKQIITIAVDMVRGLDGISNIIPKADTAAQVPPTIYAKTFFLFIIPSIKSTVDYLMQLYYNCFSAKNNNHSFNKCSVNGGVV